MLKDGNYSENEQTKQNMIYLSEQQAICAEKRICELSELVFDASRAARVLSNDGYGIYEILGMLIEGSCFDFGFGGEISLPENRDRIISYINSIESKDKALFSEMLTESLIAENIAVAESDFLQNEKSEETFIYVKNRLADEAFDVFSQDFDDPRVSYAASFKEAARAVSLGICEYCLLPLEERGGARISGIASLLFAEDLKIDSVTPVFGLDGSADMKYALVSRKFSVPEICEDDDRYLEIRMAADSTKTLADVFAAAQALSVEIYRVNTVAFDTEDGRIPYFSIVFRKNGESFSSLLVYLTLFCSSYTAVGIYKNLE